MSETFDNKRLMKPLGLKDIDKAFARWWDQKLDLHLSNDSGSKKKVPVHFVSPERWNLARKSGIRDTNGTIVLPIIAISRTKIGGPNEGAYGRIVADQKKPHVYRKRVHPKSSLVKELVKNRKWTIDPSLPIYEVFTSRVANHMLLQYEVSIWTQYVDQMNEVIEKVGLEYDYLSVKSFAFKTEDGFFFMSFQDDEMADESNIDDFTDSERLVRRTFTFNVPGYVIPESNERESSFRRYLSQTKLVFKNEVALTQEEYEKLIGGY